MSGTDITDIDLQTLRNWPLPMPRFDDDKEVRGHAVVVAGSREMPGAALLAANGVLRAGAGKVTIATAAHTAAHVATALPEARVVALAETPGGGFAAEGIRRLGELAAKADALLIGPGMQDEQASAELVRALLPRYALCKVILDAAALAVLRPPGGASLLADPVDWEHMRFAEPVLLTPHAGEMAHATGMEKKEIEADPRGAAQRAAQRWNAVVALKGALTIIAAPDGKQWQQQGGNVGLAISGSGDTLAGIIAGLAARGASLEQAAAWGVALHAAAGDQLAMRFGTLGYLAREIPAEIPALLRTLAQA
ncbi:NAD(P)H-hydrate dehydratase [Pseudoduganella ginsengisoli]|uniref:ADP-dependent (S)-NAD(P)H-hydrate dehydratase n=1 Tax=Pseudoduganella ginsengisoli TaxID=1462440 RepID=A0A6L6Q5A2_9BURK|nr:NAD(P)H-hydrate dehydratase [Pseudoduganella ginsengisoli]MTW04458.1 NAD(P)H-hydrate dehydratase [Pseudoduganella ginsengisoli]